MNEVVADFVDSSLNWRVAMQPCGVVPQQRVQTASLHRLRGLVGAQPRVWKALELEASFHLLTRAACKHHLSFCTSFPTTLPNFSLLPFVTMVHTTALVAAAASLLLTAPVSAEGMYSKNSPVLQINGMEYDRLIAKSNYTSVSSIQ